MGDGKSSDMICGRFAGYGKTMNRLVWSCDCAATDSDNPKHKCSLLNYNRVRKAALVAMRNRVGDQEGTTQGEIDEARDYLASISQYPGVNAFFDHVLADEEAGIFGLTPVCRLHQFDQGICDKLSRTLFIDLTGYDKSEFDAIAIRLARTYRQTAFNHFPCTRISKALPT